MGLTGDILTPLAEIGTGLVTAAWETGEAAYTALDTLSKHRKL